MVQASMNESRMYTCMQDSFMLACTNHTTPVVVHTGTRMDEGMHMDNWTACIVHNELLPQENNDRCTTSRLNLYEPL